MIDKYEIATLAEDYETKRLRLEAMMYMNTPVKYEARIKARVEMHLAEAEMMEALRRLEMAKLGIRSS